ncbi:GNAT family protein [Petroclostridium sp. X23]|uniref:GNAT family N-acetyltransferase n=1 Tax=Petroclostridium sp. X23 TaxID=3045146 RepID=UPI0024AD1185|nr:GNAT family protein [Petroclostridium sp. X23]WHH58399.1 GNAT family protein [Petroclostridium sp. X23]
MDNKLFNNFPILETERLILQQIIENDQDALFKYWSDDMVTRYMNISKFKDKTEALDMIQLLNSLFEEKKAIRWGIYSKDLNCIIGTCGYNSGLEEDQFIAEIGYELGREHWGKGYMAEALKSMLSYGFNFLHLNRIEAYVMVGNHQSASLLNKLGFKKEGLLREHGFYKGRFWDEYIFSLIKTKNNPS